MNIQIRATVSQAWPLIKSSKRVFLCTFLALILLQSILLCVQEEFGILFHHANWISPLFTIIMVFISSPIMAGFAMIGLKRARGQAVKWKSGLIYYKNIFPLFSAYFISVFATWLVAAALVSALLLLFSTITHALHVEALRLIIAFLFLMIAMLVVIAVNVFFNFSYMLILDQKERFHLAVWHSIKMVKANFKKLYGLILLLSLFNLLGLIPVGLGLLWTVPLTYVCIGLVYRKLRAD